MKLKCLIPTRNVHLIWLKTRNSAVWTSKSSFQLFWGSYQKNLLFSSNQRSTNVSSKRGTVGALIQNTETTSEELSSEFQFSNIKVFFGLFLDSTLIFHIKAHQHKEQTSISWCWKAIKGIKIKETWLGQTIMNDESFCSISNAAYWYYALKICLTLHSANFRASLGTLNTLHYSVCFLPSVTKESEASWFCLWVEVRSAF